jgi:hypothetical protein
MGLKPFCFTNVIYTWGFICVVHLTSDIISNNCRKLNFLSAMSSRRHIPPCFFLEHLQYDKGAGRFGDRIPVDERISTLVRHSSEAHPATGGWVGLRAEYFPEVNGRGLALITHPI